MSSHCRCLLTVWFCMCTYSMHAFTHPHKREIVLTKAPTGCKTEMIKLHHWIHKTTQIKAAVIKQLDLSVTGGSERKKNHKPCTVTVFIYHRSKNTVWGTCYSCTCMIKYHLTFAF